MTRIDSHQHFWHYDPAHHVWMTGEMAALRRDGRLPDGSPGVAPRKAPRGALRSRCG